MLLCCLQILALLYSCLLKIIKPFAGKMVLNLIALSWLVQSVLSMRSKYVLMSGFITWWDILYLGMLGQLYNSTLASFGLSELLEWSVCSDWCVCSRKAANMHSRVGVLDQKHSRPEQGWNGLLSESFV